MHKVLTIIFFASCFAVHAQTKDQNQQRIDELTKRVNDLLSKTPGKSSANSDSLLRANADLKAQVKRLQDSLKMKGKSFQYTENSKECVRLHYQPSQTKLNYEGYYSIDSIVNLFSRDPSHKIKLIGHADKIGDESYNLQISHQRVISLRDYLVSKKKIPSDKIDIEWHGSGVPLSDAKKQSLNRRVEVFLVD